MSDQEVVFLFRFKIGAIAACILLAALTTSTSALEITADPTTQFQFTSNDFSLEEADEGIFITSVPSTHIASMRYGARTLKAGDTLTTQALNDLTLQTSCVTDQTAVVEYCMISDGKISGIKSLKINILPQKNLPPTAADSTFETYKNIPNQGALNAKDPENGTLQYTVIKEPKYGTVEVNDDGTFTYTPNENKVGKDSFIFTVTDNAGNTSNEAKVSIKIKKPTERTTYADMHGEDGEYVAMWLKEKNIMTGANYAGNLCFEPEKAVSRGEFLIMVMKLFHADNELAALTSGFHDEVTTPTWMQPYIASALRNGMITGINTEDGVVFHPQDDLTKAEAASMIQNIINYPSESATEVFSSEEDAIPAWAARACAALSKIGIDLSIEHEDDVLTRLDAAKLLYQIDQLMAEDIVTTFYWLQE